jgi:hypothetical protein
LSKIVAATNGFDRRAQKSSIASSAGSVAIAAAAAT